MAESAIKAAAQLLGKLLVDQINHLDEVRGQVEGLKDELNSLAAYAVDAARSRCQDEVVRVALSDARNVAYDCEDVIEKYIHEVACPGYEEFEGCQMGSVMRWACLGMNAVPVLKIHTQIAELNKRISALQNRMKTYGVSDRINAVDNNPARNLRRVHTHNREETVVVGFKNQVDELVERLLDYTDKTVIVLCGMGGIGKSTMARELYGHPKLKESGSFTTFGWAVASQRLQPDKVLKELMYSLVSDDDHERRRKIDYAIEANRAHRALYELLREFKCLVVIDDIWTSSDWAELEDAFPRNYAKGSRILLTTRNKETVSRLDPAQVYLHPIMALDDTMSWKLFEMTTFPSATCTDSTKMELGREMLRHCKGVPLAVVVLAKLLKTKERAEDWQQIRDNISAHIQRGGIPSVYKEVFDVLKVSYDELPFHLKHCFLHLAFLTVGGKFPTAHLYQLWIAEGVVLTEDPNELEEDIAEIIEGAGEQKHGSGG